MNSYEFSRPRQLRVLVCDPDPLSRAGIRSLLESTKHALVIGELGGPGPDGGIGDFDVAVVSSGKAGTLDLSALDEVRATSVVLLVSPDDRRTLATAINAGVTRLVDRANVPHDLELAFEAVLDGHAYASPSLTTYLLTWLAVQLPEPRHKQVQPGDVLSSRELEVLMLIGEGKNNVEIGTKLHIRETTVRSHVSRVLAKLNLTTRAEAVLVGHHQRLGADYLTGVPLS